MTDSRIDPRAEALGVYITNGTGPFKIMQVKYQDEQEAQGQHTIWYTVLDEHGAPLGNQDVYMDWVGRPPIEDPPSWALTDGKGSANLPMYANLDTTKKNGPYFAYVGATIEHNTPHNIQSDIVNGMGLPEHHHVNFLLTFQKNGTPPPPEPTPPPTGSWVIQSQSDSQIVLVKS